MSLYHYRAMTAEGRTLTGTLQAADVSMLEQQMRATGMWLLEATLAHNVAAAATDAVDRMRVRRGELIGFFLQLSLLLKAGVNLPRALERLAADATGSKLGSAILRLHDQVVVGVPLHSAMQQFPNVFAPHVVAIVAAGEATGKLPEIFSSLTQYIEWMEQLASDIRQAVVYPLMVGSAATGLVVLLFTFVVPRFVSLLTDLNLVVPTLTRAVMAVSAAFVNGWPVILAFAVGLPVGIKLALRNTSFARKWDRMRMRLPVFGSLVSMLALARFAQTLALLYRSGITLVRGLEISRDIVGNHAIAHALEDVRRGLQEGTPLHRAMAAHDVFPPALITMVATGESSGSLDVALQGIADYFNKLVPRRLKLVFAVFDPAVMLFLIGVVATVGAAVVLPILQLWQAR